MDNLLLLRIDILVLFFSWNGLPDLEKRKNKKKKKNRLEK